MLGTMPTLRLVVNDYNRRVFHGAERLPSAAGTGGRSTLVTVRCMARLAVTKNLLELRLCTGLLCSLEFHMWNKCPVEVLTRRRADQGHRIVTECCDGPLLFRTIPYRIRRAFVAN
jgi:hypothetical protein